MLLIWIGAGRGDALLATGVRHLGEAVAVGIVERGRIERLQPRVDVERRRDERAEGGRDGRSSRQRKMAETEALAAQIKRTKQQSWLRPIVPTGDPTFQRTILIFSPVYLRCFADFLFEPLLFLFRPFLSLQFFVLSCFAQILLKNFAFAKINVLILAAKIIVPSFL